MQGGGGLSVGVEGVSGFVHIQISRIVILAFLIFVCFINIFYFIFEVAKLDSLDGTDIDFPVAGLIRLLARFRGAIILALR